MEAHDRVGEVGVQTHSRRKGNGHIGEEAHAKGSQSGNGSGSRDEITLDDCFAEHVVLVGQALVDLEVGRRADTGATSISENGSCRL